jgi:hypothetical protein
MRNQECQVDHASLGSPNDICVSFYEYVDLFPS